MPFYTDVHTYMQSNSNGTALAASSVAFVFLGGFRQPRTNFYRDDKRIPVPDIVAAVEEGLSKISTAEAQLARTRITGCLTKARPATTNFFG